MSMFFTLVRCSIILSRLFLTYMHPCFLPYVQIYWIFVRLLMSHKKCPIWQVLFIINFGTFAFFRIVPYSLQVHNVLLQMSKMAHLFFPFCLILLVSTVWKVFLVKFLIFFLPYRIILTPNVHHVISVFLVNSMNSTFEKNIEYLLWTFKNHLVHNACVKIPHVSKK